jgi:hypothetical protein
MRDPKRIERICEKLRRLWHECPDQRLGQLIENYVIPSGNLRGSITCWIFYAEDDETERKLDQELKRLRRAGSSLNRKQNSLCG